MGMRDHLSKVKSPGLGEAEGELFDTVESPAGEGFQSPVGEGVQSPVGEGNQSPVGEPEGVPCGEHQVLVGEEL